MCGQRHGQYRRQAGLRADGGLETVEVLVLEPVGGVALPVRQQVAFDLPDPAGHAVLEVPGVGRDRILQRRVREVPERLRYQRIGDRPERPDGALHLRRVRIVELGEQVGDVVVELVQAPFDPGLVEDRAALVDRRYPLLLGDLADPVHRLHDLPPETDVDRLVPDLSAELRDLRALLLHRHQWGAPADAGADRVARESPWGMACSADMRC